MINWDVSDADKKLIEAIAKRAVRAYAEIGLEKDFVDACMDITAAHANGCPLDLKALLKADQFNFAHDVFGIGRHVNTKNGRLRHGFWPRYAAKEVAQR